MHKLIVLISLLVVNTGSIQAQKFLKKLTKSTTDKIGKEVGNIMADELSTRLADAAVKPLESAFDEYMKESYEESTGEEYDEENREEMQVKMNAYLESLTKDVKYEDEYRFSSQVDIETKDFGSKKGEMISLLGSDAGYSAILQEQDSRSMLIIFDAKNNSMISYDKNKNTAMALPFNTDLMKASLSNEKNKHEKLDFSLSGIEKLKKTKKVMGHTSYGYRYDDPEYRSDVYMSGSFPLSYAQAFGGIFQDYASSFYKSETQTDLSDNMIMYAESTRKDDDKKSTWEVVGYDENPESINTTKMKFENLYSN